MEHQQREFLSKSFMAIMSIFGLVIFFQSLLNLSTIPNSFLILLLFIILLGITEYYPFPVWKGFTTINFPLLYVMLLIYDLHLTIVVYSSIVLAVNLLHERPLRSILFNPAQLIVSLWLTNLITMSILSIKELTFTANIFEGIMTYILFLMLFYFINNLIVDLVLWLRPQPYSFNNWKHKLLSESTSATFSILYGVIFYVLGNQNRGEIDVFSYFFFFSPLIALALIGSSYVRLNTEKNRLKRMFKLTRNLNTYMLKEDGYKPSMEELKDFMGCDEISLLLREDSLWKVVYPFESQHLLTDDIQEEINHLHKMTEYNVRQPEQSTPLQSIFTHNMKAFIYIPLIIDEETLGMVVLAKSRSNSFIEAEKNVLATLANQLAAMIKTKHLIQEQHERYILEERNRIARNIHDGVAQNLAAAVLQLESSKRALLQNRNISEHYIDRCMEHLRNSLWEVRNSIYTLRPPRKNQTGLIPAIHKKLQTFEQETDIEMIFQLKGKPFPISTMVEQIIFDIFKESVQNSIKHSLASEININLHYQTNGIELTIEDNGKGFSLFHAMIKAENEPHFGIIQMNELAEKISASLDIQSKPSNGTTVKLTIPQLESEGLN